MEPEAGQRWNEQPNKNYISFHNFIRIFEANIYTQTRTQYLCCHQTLMMVPYGDGLRIKCTMKMEKKIRHDLDWVSWVSWWYTQAVCNRLLCSFNAFHLFSLQYNLNKFYANHEEDIAKRSEQVTTFTIKCIVYEKLVNRFVDLLWILNNFLFRKKKRTNERFGW